MAIQKNTSVSRRRFVGVVLAAAGALFLLLTGRIVRRGRVLRRRRTVVLPASLPEGISFHDGVLAVRHGERLTLLAARCTHLGCTLEAAGDGTIRCPCHGSRFDERGRVLQGPATQPLERLSWHRDRQGRPVVNL